MAVRKYAVIPICQATATPEEVIDFIISTLDKARLILYIDDGGIET
jgi:hypothetical protein